MAIAIGAATSVATGDGLVLVAPAASGGTAPYTYQWYMSTTAGFTPGAGNLVAGATGLSFQANPLPNVPTYYVCKATDNVAATVLTVQYGITWTGRKLRSYSTQVDVNQVGDPGASTYGYGAPDGGRGF
jgi:hypothetical protein